MKLFEPQYLSFCLDAFMDFTNTQHIKLKPGGEGGGAGTLILGHRNKEIVGGMKRSVVSATWS